MAEFSGKLDSETQHQDISTHILEGKPENKKVYLYTKNSYFKTRISVSLPNMEDWTKGLYPLWEVSKLSNLDSKSLHVAAKIFDACVICGYPYHLGACPKISPGWPCTKNHFRGKGAEKFHNEHFHVDDYKEFKKAHLSRIQPKVPRYKVEE